MSKPWGGLGGAGAWALDAERAEEEERETAAALPAPEPPAASFPSLREVAAVGGTGKSKKKKGTTLSLSEFATYGPGGFRDSPASTDSDRWSRATPQPNNGERERPRIVLDPPKRDSSTTPMPPAEAGRSRPSPFGAARPREDVLTEKGLDWRKMETEIDEKKSSRPTSSQSSRPGSAHSSRPGSPGSQVSAVGTEGAPKPRPKVNPFGNAKPREVILQEKGKDWRKIDLELEHRRIDRPETNEERVLKEEINLLKVDLKETEGNNNDEHANRLSEKISQMQRDLELLTTELDDKIRFGQRPGSGAGRVAAPAPTNLAEAAQVTDSMGRPRSHGGIEQHPKPMEERWGFQGSRERSSFVGNRSSDRMPTGQRW